MKKVTHDYPYCPHCGRKDPGAFENPDVWDDNDIDEHECGSCEKVYWVRTDIRYTFTASSDIEGARL